MGKRSSYLRKNIFACLFSVEYFSVQYFSVEYLSIQYFSRWKKKYLSKSSLIKHTFSWSSYSQFFVWKKNLNEKSNFEK